MVHGPEAEEPRVTVEVVGNDPARPVGSLALAHTPEELGAGYERFIDPEGRFTLDTLRDGSNQAVLAETVLPRRESFRERFVRDLIKGVISLNFVRDAWQSVAGGDFGFSAEYPIDQKTYAAVVAANPPADGLFLEDKDTVVCTNSEIAAKLDELVDERARLQAVEAAYKRWEKVLSKFYIDPLEDSDDQEGLRRLALQQAFVFAANPRQGRPGPDDHDGLILNFGPPLTQEQLCTFARAQYDVANLTSGYLNERFRTLVVLPENHPSLKVELKDENGRPKTVNRDAYTDGYTIFISAKRFRPSEESPETPKERPPESPQEQSSETPEGQPSMSEAQKLLAQHLKPGEKTEGPGAIRWTMSQGRDLWATLVHEMFHLVFGDLLYRISDETRISLYAFVDGEAGSEMAVAILMRALGEEYIQNRITEKDLIAFGKILTKMESERKRDKEPDGLFVVAGRQVDLKSKDALPARQKTQQPLDMTKQYALV